MKLKLISSFLIMASLYGVSMCTYAADVQFNNQSKYNLSLSEDNNTMPTRFFNSGTSIIIDEASFKEICKNQPKQCKFYISDHDGNVATVTFQGTTVANFSNNTKSEVWVSGYGSSITVKDK